MQVNFHSKEDLDAQVTIMENQPDGACVRLRLKSEGNMVDLFVRNAADAERLFDAVSTVLDYFEA